MLLCACSCAHLFRVTVIVFADDQNKQIILDGDALVNALASPENAEALRAAGKLFGFGTNVKFSVSGSSHHLPTSVLQKYLP